MYYKRGDLQEQLLLQKKKVNLAKIKYDKLDIIRNNTQRTLSASPGNNIQSQTQKMYKPVKRAKHIIPILWSKDHFRSSSETRHANLFSK